MKINYFDSMCGAIEPSNSEATSRHPPRWPGRWIAAGKTEGLVAIALRRRQPLRPSGAPPQRVGRMKEVNNLQKTCITKFSHHALINHATLAGLDVKVKTRKAA